MCRTRGGNAPLDWILISFGKVVYIRLRIPYRYPQYWSQQRSYAKHTHIHKHDAFDEIVAKAGKSKKDKKNKKKTLLI